MYPNPKTMLYHESPFQLVIAVLMSAQTTDVGVNKVTPALFAAYPDANAMAEADVADLEDKIKTIGLYRNKAKNMKKTAIMIRDEFGGQVPNTREELEKLPGVGRKTANVVLSEAFGVPTIAVDTHVERVTKRMGIVPPNASVRETEEILMARIPENRWRDAHHQFIYFGREYCTARNPKCRKDPRIDFCECRVLPQYG
ncbi:endonuclease III [Aerococcus agrisoli]|uniref:Endonuclease III n=2 Tax=Aerococcus agrisoli TaxID=2487350 RepID=A0A3N4GET1_9LACT|nr:endonuclease III [Aerococcus agrisoli]